MKKYEYDTFYFQPTLQLNPQEFKTFMKTELNKLGRQGWLAIHLDVIAQNNVLIGLAVIACRELLPPAILPGGD